EGRFWAYVGIGAGVGALGGALGYGAGAAVSAGITAAGYTAASTTTAGYILSGVAAGAVGGAVDGVVTGGLTQLLGNIVDGKTGSAVWDGVDNAAGWGALTGGVTGGIAGGVTGRIIRRSFAGRATIMNAHSDFRGHVRAAGLRAPYPKSYDLNKAGAINKAFNRGGAGKLATHGYVGGDFVEFNYRTAAGALQTHSPSGAALGNFFSRRFTSVELLACYPGKGKFAQSFATASRTATRAPTGTTTFHGGYAAGTWSFERGHRVLTFYPNRYVTGFVRLFGY